MSAAAIYASAVAPQNASITLAVDGVEYFAEAPRFADAAQAVWRCYALFPVGDSGRRVKHASGLHAPGENGENLPGLNYV